MGITQHIRGTQNVQYIVNLMLLRGTTGRPDAGLVPMRGFTAYQTLLKSYISEGLRRDEVRFDQHTARKLADVLKRRGVAEKVLQETMEEIAHDS